ncbi:hypothetical protein PUNSTDRAFT_42222 [Punctularia strigosozonata HHB-11173 SS5]|uniref:uncharacterized protein n=1 Tax=Punctularia strigosozonata (strain HHB-11173) TaxID=741275 RepID=UPI000441758F|nr:uncharacterized protein PUNSTDRAFT_42222 [Punctularia strigosozonata HHB-11173 SS5]EIN12695.1 hypothetical protein PUNSTDRAFT_42222 [Punctularia strigosozonata HHB-11173 SS5]
MSLKLISCKLQCLAPRLVLFRKLKTGMAHITEETTSREPSPEVGSSEDSKEIPVILEHPSQHEEKGWPLESVVAFVAAVCLAHFLIVTGGWTNKVVGWLEGLGIRQG